MDENSDNIYRIAGVAVEKTVYSFDKIFDYVIPETFLASVGYRVLVPFGRGDQKRQGVIIYTKSVGNIDKLKSIEKVLDKKPVLTNEMINLALFMKERYYCTIYDCIKAMLPVGINYKLKTTYTINKDYNLGTDFLDEKQKIIYEYLLNKKKSVPVEDIVKDLSLSEDTSIMHEMAMSNILIKQDEVSRKTGDKICKMIRLVTDCGNAELTSKQKEAYEVLNMSFSLSVKELCYFVGCTQVVADGLVKKGVAEYFEEEAFRIPSVYNNGEKSQENIKLTPEQQLAYDDLYMRYKSDKAQVSLLYGITGSGKTLVFMKMIDKVVCDNRGVIVMVPEISLTPQLMNIFTSRYGHNVAMFHSGLSAGERLDEWKRVKNGYAKIALGTRSAIFAPFENIGLIIIDEEQEYTYKSESNPRFHARDLAKYRCNKHNCLLLLSSATPSIESFYNCCKGRYSINRLSKRYGNAVLPDVVTIDMNKEQQKGNFSGISSELLRNIEYNVENGKQSIILLNRRGHNTFVSCKKCNEVISCPNCSISLTYHSDNNRLMCHYCGYSEPMKQECPKCHSKSLKFSGLGTQRAEQNLIDTLPMARILRMDADSTIAKFSHEKKLKDFSDGKYDIMIGTQMVAKGLDFPNVTLVGVLSADQILYSNDYRSYERTFSLLTQVVGRAGRGELKGKAIIQTFTPDNETIMLASKQDYDSFYKSEILLRKAMLYPPFSDICMVGFLGDNEIKTAEAAKYFTENLIKLAKTEYSHIPLRIVGYSPATINKISNKFRYKCVMKFRNSVDFRKMISNLLITYGKNKKFNKISIYVDVNPDTII